ncbi:MAG: DUF1573 domain-containing protein [Planctomyces sp.]|jgi:hypothetical protein
MVTNQVHESEKGVQTVCLWLLALIPFSGSAMFALRDASAPPLNVSEQRPSLTFNTHLIYQDEARTRDQSVLRYSYRFRNRGKEPVQITKISPSCACLVPTVTEKVIAPGQSAELNVQVRTAAEKPGFHEYMVNVAYSDPLPREAVVYLKLVLPEQKVIIEPRAIYILGAASGHSHSVTISDFRPSPLNVLRVTSSSPLFTPTILSQEQNGEGTVTKVGVEVSETLPAGRQSGVILAETDDSEFRLLEIPIAVQVRERSPDVMERLRVSPEELSMAVSTAEDADGKLKLTFPKSWEVGQLFTHPPELIVREQEVSDENAETRTMSLKLGFSGIPSVITRHGIVTLIANEGTEMISVRVRLVWPQTRKP